MSEQLCTIELNGRKLQAAAGRYVLDVARHAGIDIPTLCYHEAVEPVGACRLCLVEVTHPDWGGWSGLMTACLYPVSEGLQIKTRSPAVQKARQQILALLLARCPGSELIRDLAAHYHADIAALRPAAADADSCILCGLCTRVCDSYATSAISTIGRGALKAIGAFAGETPADCAGCGACALVCPTGNIAGRRTAGGYEIWERSFDSALARVDRQRCLGCGACEEACPFAVARVSLQASGLQLATIPEEHCRGCGACVGACPSGAIEQQGFTYRTLTGEPPPKAQHVVFACRRSALSNAAQLPPDSHIAELPCIGRVSLPVLLGTIARGRRGVLVLGRHQQTCRLKGAENPPEDLVRRADEALALSGGGRGRVAFATAEPGPDGPARAVQRFVTSLGPAPPLLSIGEVPAAEGLDTSLNLLGWLADRHGWTPDGTAYLERCGLPAARPGGPVLLAGDLPYLDVLAAPLLAPTSLPAVLRMALELLARLGHRDTGIGLSRCGSLPHGAAERASLAVIFTLSAREQQQLANAGIAAESLDQLLLDSSLQLAGKVRRQDRLVATDGSPAQRALVRKAGFVAVDVGPDPLPERFALSPELRLLAERRLGRAEAAGARALLVPDPGALGRWALCTRHGSWRGSRVLPLMPHQLAWHALFEPSLAERFLGSQAGISRNVGAAKEVA